MATDTSSSTVTGPKRLVTFRISTSGMESPFEHPAPVRQRKAHQEVEQRHRAVDGEGLEGGGRGELPLAREFDEPDGRREGGVLDELDQEAHGRRHRDPAGLRDDDVAELVRRAEAEDRKSTRLNSSH